MYRELGPGQNHQCAFDKIVGRDLHLPPELWDGGILAKIGWNGIWVLIDEGPTAEPCGECDSCRDIADGSSIDVVELDLALGLAIGESFVGVDLHDATARVDGHTVSMPARSIALALARER